MNNAIIYFFSYLVEAIILWQYTSNLFTDRHGTKTKLITFGILYSILFFACLLEIRWLNGSLFLLTNFIFLATQCCLKWYSAFFHSAIISSIMGMCELMGYGIISHFTPHFFAKASLFHTLTIHGIFSKTLAFTIIHILIHVMKGKQNNAPQYDKSIFLLTLIPITSIFVMLTYVSIGEFTTFPPYIEWMITLSAVFLLVINLLVFGINQYNQKKSLEFMEMQLLLQKESDSAEYYKMLVAQNENQSILIHDIKKHLQSVALLNEQNDHEKIHAYIHQLLQSSDLKESTRLCDHDMLNAILCRYQRHCGDSHIAFHADIRSGTMDFIADKDLTSLVCNLMDNAVEAAVGIPESYIEVSTSKKERTPFVVITVVNSCRKDPFSKSDGKLNTNKTDNRRHGFGIKSICKIVRKYGGDIQMYYHNDTATFHTIITLKRY